MTTYGAETILHWIRPASRQGTIVRNLYDLSILTQSFARTSTREIKIIPGLFPGSGRHIGLPDVGRSKTFAPFGSRPFIGKVAKAYLYTSQPADIMVLKDWPRMVIYPQFAIRIN